MASRLRVLTWNVGRLYSPGHNNRLDEADLPEVARILAELDPDVALLQEIVDERQIVQLCRRLGAWRGEYAGALATACVYDRRTTVLAKKARAPRFEDVSLGTTGRGAVIATFNVDGGRRAAAFSVHFDVFSPNRRADQARTLAELAEGRAESLVIAGGDFNLDPAFAAGTDNRRDQETFARLTAQFVDAGRDAGATLCGLLRVDHLLVRGSQNGMVARVSPRRLPLGDHQPLVLDVDLDSA
jgi:endonuclease/exonuclease/phosphatase family metal-dependent hydrolase